jgi:hypothetical protein
MEDTMETEDVNLVETWLKKDTQRWMAGIAAGLFAGLVMLAFAGLMSVVAGMEFWFPIKVSALPFLGNGATEYGMILPNILVGLIVTEVICAILGLIYAHFTATNALPSLLGAGLVWAAFSWIFIFNLFVQSFRPVLNARLPSGAAFPVMLVFGISLTSVAFFDKMIRGNRA